MPRIDGWQQLSLARKSLSLDCYPTDHDHSEYRYLRYNVELPHVPCMEGTRAPETPDFLSAFCGIYRRLFPPWQSVSTGPYLSTPEANHKVGTAKVVAVRVVQFMKWISVSSPLT